MPATLPATRHTVAATRSGSSRGMDWEAEYVITFTYAPGLAEPELLFVAIDPGADDVGAFTDLAQKDLEDWAQEWLDENYAECLEIAERGREPDAARRAAQLRAQIPTSTDPDRLERMAREIEGRKS